MFQPPCFTLFEKLTLQRWTVNNGIWQDIHSDAQFWTVKSLISSSKRPAQIRIRCCENMRTVWLFILNGLGRVSIQFQMEKSSYWRERRSERATTGTSASLVDSLSWEAEIVTKPNLLPYTGTYYMLKTFANIRCWLISAEIFTIFLFQHKLWSRCRDADQKKSVFVKGLFYYGILHNLHWQHFVAMV